MDYEKFTQILHQLQSQVPTRDSNEESQRQTVLRTLRKLTHIAETPSERIARMCYPDIYLFTIVRILVDLKIFEFISQANTSVNVDQIAERTTADPVLLSRMLKFVCSQDIVEETGPEEYVANGITDKLA
jgi:demethylsterigmatocystin 6-O-methyltransferase